MKTINIREAKIHLSRLVEAAAKGDSFIIEVAGEPKVKVTAIECAVDGRARRLGFMSGQLSVPDDFDSMGRAEIESLLADRGAPD
jgi:prevent-host-death family protein